MSTSDDIQKKVGKNLKGTVIQKVLERTITVLVERKEPHPKYKKYVKISKKFLVHLPEGMDCSVGDYVQIDECRPISKRKSFVLSSVIREAVKS